MYNVKCLNAISSKGTDLLTEDYRIVEDMNDANGVLVRSAAMHEMELPEGLECIARAGAGVNNIPLDRCAEKGIVVFNTPGANANGVKELVTAALFMGARDLAGGLEWVKANKDDPNIGKTMEKAKKNFAGTEVKGKTIAVVGLGAIGVMVANTCVALGMDVIGYDPFISVNNALQLSQYVKINNKLDAVAAQADYMTVHVPLAPATKGMINKDIFAAMKKDIILLNFSRDALVEEEALLAALEDGTVRRYVTDFPTPATAGLQKVVAFPHLGASTEESEDNCAAMATREMMNYLENGNIINSVNYPRCDMGVVQTAARICVFNKNVPNMIGQITSALAKTNVNIAAMTNNSRGEYAYNMIDTDQDIDEAVAKELLAIPEVFKVRVIRK